MVKSGQTKYIYNTNKIQWKNKNSKQQSGKGWFDRIYNTNKIQWKNQIKNTKQYNGKVWFDRIYIIQTRSGGRIKQQTVEW